MNPITKRIADSRGVLLEQKDPIKVARDTMAEYYANQGNHSLGELEEFRKRIESTPGVSKVLPEILEVTKPLRDDLKAAGVGEKPVRLTAKIPNPPGETAMSQQEAKVDAARAASNAPNAQAAPAASTPPVASVAPPVATEKPTTSNAPQEPAVVPPAPPAGAPNPKATPRAPATQSGTSKAPAAPNAASEPTLFSGAKVPNWWEKVQQAGLGRIRTMDSAIEVEASPTALMDNRKGALGAPSLFDGNIGAKGRVRVDAAMPPDQMPAFSEIPKPRFRTPAPPPAAPKAQAASTPPAPPPSVAPKAQAASTPPAPPPPVAPKAQAVPAAPVSPAASVAPPVVGQGVTNKVRGFLGGKFAQGAKSVGKSVGAKALAGGLGIGGFWAGDVVGQEVGAFVADAAGVENADAKDVAQYGTGLATGILAAGAATSAASGAGILGSLKGAGAAPLHPAGWVPLASYVGAKGLHAAAEGSGAFDKWSEFKTNRAVRAAKNDEYKPEDASEMRERISDKNFLPDIKIKNAEARAAQAEKDDAEARANADPGWSKYLSNTFKHGVVGAAQGAGIGGGAVHALFGAGHPSGLAQMIAPGRSIVTDVGRYLQDAGKDLGRHFDFAQMWETPAETARARMK